MPGKLTIGIVGAGGFALFAAKAFMKVEGIRIKSITDINPSAAKIFAKEIGSSVIGSLEEILQDKEIDLVYIATPPFLHYVQSMQALSAGKHVICEKPAALKADEARELASFARTHNLLYVVNLMQRYNPLYVIVKRIIDEKWLGDFVHGFFENYASDEKLVRDHWFWDTEKSGGIFIEHGVHFFDMFDGWFGKGEVIHAFEIGREGTNGRVIDRVQAICMYQNNPVTFYHGFNQPKVLDRQEMRLQFDKGDITFYEWVPVRIRVHGALTIEAIEFFRNAFPGAIMEEKDADTRGAKYAKGKFKDIIFDSVVTITSGDIHEKMGRYEQLVISMINDQWSWIRDPGHVRVIDERNAVESLRIAEQATRSAKRF